MTPGPDSRWDGEHPSTYPPTPGKTIPGAVGTSPLHRLYPTWDTASFSASTANTSAKNSACAQITPNPSAGLDCDEYPFASSWEGPGAGTGDFSVRYVNNTQNRSAGGTLGAWYSAQRILNRDAFFVQIQP